MTLPLRLYKYEPFTAQSIQNIKDQVIYFGSPLNFNDPYDCALFPSIKEPTDSDVEKLRQHYLAKPTLDNAVRRLFQMESVPDLRLRLVRMGREALEKSVKDFLARRGVSCFSERNDSLLMWAHYGGHYKGFCLEFLTSDEIFRKIRKVDYVARMPVVDLVQLCDSSLDVVSDLYCTKAADWSYEREWRLLHSEVGMAYRYPASALTGVYLGPNMPFTAFEIISLILAGQNQEVKIYQGTRSKADFSVEFSPVTYMSHLEAKRKGIAEGGDV